MEAQQLSLEGFVVPDQKLEREAVFGSGFDLVIPPVNALNRAGNLGTECQLFLNQCAPDFHGV